MYLKNLNFLINQTSKIKNNNNNDLCKNPVTICKLRLINNMYLFNILFVTLNNCIYLNHTLNFLYYNNIKFTFLINKLSLACNFFFNYKSLLLYPFNFFQKNFLFIKTVKKNIFFTVVDSYGKVIFRLSKGLLKFKGKKKKAYPISTKQMIRGLIFFFYLRKKNFLINIVSKLRLFFLYFTMFFYNQIFKSKMQLLNYFFDVPIKYNLVVKGSSRNKSIRFILKFLIKLSKFKQKNLRFLKFKYKKKKYFFFNKQKKKKIFFSRKVFKFNQKLSYLYSKNIINEKFTNNLVLKLLYFKLLNFFKIFVYKNFFKCYNIFKKNTRFFKKKFLNIKFNFSKRLKKQTTIIKKKYNLLKIFVIKKNIFNKLLYLNKINQTNFKRFKKYVNLRKEIILLSKRLFKILNRIKIFLTNFFLFKKQKLANNFNIIQFRSNLFQTLTLYNKFNFSFFENQIKNSKIYFKNIFFISYLMNFNISFLLSNNYGCVNTINFFSFIKNFYKFKFFTYKFKFYCFYDDYNFKSNKFLILNSLNYINGKNDDKYKVFQNLNKIFYLFFLFCL